MKRNVEQKCRVSFVTRQINSIVFTVIRFGIFRKTLFRHHERSNPKPSNKARSEFDKHPKGVFFFTKVYVCFSKSKFHTSEKGKNSKNSSLSPTLPFMPRHANRSASGNAVARVMGFQPGGVVFRSRAPRPVPPVVCDDNICKLKTIPHPGSSTAAIRSP